MQLITCVTDIQYRFTFNNVATLNIFKKVHETYGPKHAQGIILTMLDFQRIMHALHIHMHMRARNVIIIIQFAMYACAISTYGLTKHQDVQTHPSTSQNYVHS